MELNLYNSLKDPEKLMSLLKEADIATLEQTISSHCGFKLCRFS